MSINVPGMTDATGRNLVTVLEKIAAINAAGTTFDFSSFKKIQDMVKNGLAPYALPVGSQILVPWTDKATNTAYTMPFDVVHHGKATLKDLEVIPAMILQSHYATPYGVQFSPCQAFYYAKTAALPAGTYNITIPTTWSKATAGTYQFTLTQDLPVGGQLSGFEYIADRDPSVWQVKAWANKLTVTATETVAVTVGSDGTNLGSLIPAGDGTLNSIQRTGYGYNNIDYSAARQWLNSGKTIGAWYVPQTDFDRPPAELATKPGFLSGFNDDFLAVIQPIKSTTALNTVTDSSLGTTVDDYDKFFLPSLQQMYINPELADVEGPTWDYWKRASGLTAPAGRGSTQPNYITYALENHASAQSVRLRSANRSTSHTTWYVNSSGSIYSDTACTSYRFAPACAIC